MFYFVFELILRFVGKDDLKEYLSDGWNYFDIVIVSASFVSDTYADLSDISVLRAFRVLRIIRLLRQLEELRLITSVLLRSVRSLGYSGVIFLLFMYAYAVVGVSLFRATDYAASANAKLHPTQPDPYGSLGEAMFTLFRIMTGEDWTDLRYNLIAMLPDKSVTITLFHVSWMALSAFLLINLVVGAVVNNYSSMMLEVREENARRKAAADARSGRDDTASPAS